MEDREEEEDGGEDGGVAKEEVDENGQDLAGEVVECVVQQESRMEDEDGKEEEMSRFCFRGLRFRVWVRVNRCGERKLACMKNLLCSAE